MRRNKPKQKRGHRKVESNERFPLFHDPGATEPIDCPSRYWDKSAERIFRPGHFLKEQLLMRALHQGRRLPGGLPNENEYHARKSGAEQEQGVKLGSIRFLFR